MKLFIRLVGTLTVICSLSGVLLSAVNAMTKTRIEAVKRERRIAAMTVVLPEFDNNPAEETFAATSGTDIVTFHIARRGARVVGAAFESLTPEGYGGDIRLMTGINVMEGRIQGIAILDQKETPGLGANIAGKKFKSQFTNIIETTRFQVKKDGGDLDAITAATISSRAVVDAVDRGVQVFKTIKARITDL